MRFYRGCNLAKFAGAWLRHGRRTVKYTGWEVTTPDGGVKVVDTLAEAKRYIDAYLGVADNERMDSEDVQP